MVKRRNMDNSGLKRVPLPLRLPKMNAYAECWVRSVKEECPSHYWAGGLRLLTPETGPLVKVGKWSQQPI